MRIWWVIYWPVESIVLIGNTAAYDSVNTFKLFISIYSVDCNVSIHGILLGVVNNSPVYLHDCFHKDYCTTILGGWRQYYWPSLGNIRNPPPNTMVAWSLACTQNCFYFGTFTGDIQEVTALQTSELCTSIIKQLFMASKVVKGGAPVVEEVKGGGPLEGLNEHMLWQCPGNWLKRCDDPGYFGLLMGTASMRPSVWCQGPRLWQEGILLQKVARLEV